MKFLIATGQTARSLEHHVSAIGPDDFGVACDRPFWRRAGELGIVSSHAPVVAGDGTSMLLWDGAPVDGDMGFSHLLPAADTATRLTRYMDGLSSHREAQNWSGVFGCAHITAQGHCRVASDPLSQYSFFFLPLGRDLLLSNSIHLIEKVGDLLGARPARTFEACAYEAAFGVGGWHRTGLSGVEKMPADHYLDVSGGQRRFIRYAGSTFSGEHPATSYSQQLQDALQKQIGNAAALQKALPDGGLVLDLSGGKDTRLVLGAQLATGRNSFQVFLGGAAGGADQQAASRLVNHFDLDNVQYLSNLAVDEMINAERAARRAAYRYMGTANGCQADLGSEQLRGVAQVRGGCSEARTRSFFELPRGKRRRKILAYSRKLEGNVADRSFFHRVREALVFGAGDPARLLVAKLVSRGRRHHPYFTGDFLSAAQASIRGNVESLLDQGINPHDLADSYYIFDRGWRHGGLPVQVMNDSKTTFEPLNDLSLLNAHFSLREADRQDARVAFDLMSAYSVDGLLEFPFDSGTWPDRFLSDAAKMKRDKLSQVATVAKSPRVMVQQNGRVDNVYNLGLVAYMRQIQPFLRDIASSLPAHHPCWDYLRRDDFLTCLGTDGFAQSPLAAPALTLLHGFIWVSHEEERCPV